MKSLLDSPAMNLAARAENAASFRSARAIADFTKSPRGSSVEPRSRRMRRANFRKPGILFPSNRTVTLPAPAPFQKRFQPSSRRNRANTHVVPPNANLTAWKATVSSHHADLHTAETATPQDSPTEKWTFRVIAGLSGIGILWGLANSSQFVERCQRILTTMRELVL